MRTYPVPFNEESRVEATLAIAGLTPDSEPIYDAICAAVAKLFDCRIAHISVVEEDTQWYKSVVGANLGRMPKNASFCTHTIMSGEPMVIPDLSLDPRFKRHPMVKQGGPEIRFYAGVPLILSSGYRFGSLCALDKSAHDHPTELQMAILTDLGKAVVAALEKAPVKSRNTAADTGPSAFISLIGHELRTPLTILFGSLKILESQPNEKTRDILTRAARRSVEHLTQLIETIIKFSDASTGELRLNERPCDLGVLINEVAALQLPGQNGDLKSVAVQPLPQMGPVFGDPDQLRLAISALTLNAIHHGGSNVVMGAGLDVDGNLEIQVIDDGRLGDNVVLEELYKPFVIGGDINNRGTRGGLGLGLPLTRKLVELHGGVFEVRPEERRTCAVIRLPAWRLEAV